MDELSNSEDTALGKQYIANVGQICQRTSKLS